MLRRYSSGSLSRTDTPHCASLNERDLAALLSESGIIYENISLIIRRDFGPSEVTRDRADGDEGKAPNEGEAPDHGTWSAVLTFLLEGFALYGASVHPAAACIIEGAPFHEKAAVTHSLSRVERAEAVSLVSPSVIPALMANEPEHDGHQPTEPAATREHDRVAVENTDRSGPWHAVTSVLRSVADRWTHWRRERQIARTVARLTELDDHTLWDLGIPDRSLIEHAARWDRHIWI